MVDAEKQLKRLFERSEQKTHLIANWYNRGALKIQAEIRPFEPAPGNAG